MVNNIKKFNLYIISLSLLFVFMIVATASIPCDNFDFKNLDGWFDFIKINFLSFICFCMLIYSYYSYKNFQDSLKGATQIPFEIRKIESINYEHLTFLTTYVVPLISFDFNKTRQNSYIIFIAYSNWCYLYKNGSFLCKSIPCTSWFSNL